MIDLARGHPSTRLLATDELAEASSTVFARLSENRHEFSEEDRHPLQYGTDAGPMVNREIFARWLSEMYSTPEPIRPELLAITCGASFGLANTCLQVTDPLYTRRIFMITPAYFLAAKIFQDAGYGDKMHGIDEESDGFSIECLERILESDKQQDWSECSRLAGKRYKYLFYAVPTFSNPSGIVWSLEKRRALLEIARAHDMLIITDEVYDFLDYTERQRPVERLVDLDLQTLSQSACTREWGNTISNMSFSKYLGPGLRIGTIQGATVNLVNQWTSGGAVHSGEGLHSGCRCREANADRDAGGMMAQHTSYYIAEMITSGAVTTVLSKLRHVFAERAAAMLAALAAEMPSGTRIFGGRGGYFIWVGLPERPRGSGCKSVEEILAAAGTAEDGVLALSGAAFEVPGHVRRWGDRWFRLSLSWLDREPALEGIRRLGQAVRDSADDSELRS